MDFPWLPSGSDSRALFQTYVANGVFSPEDSVVRDIASLVVGDIDLGMVDLGEWMFEKSLLDIIGFQTAFTEADQAQRFGEDDKLLRRFRDLSVPTACSEIPTLIYRLGGFSNKDQIRMSSTDRKFDT